MILGLMAGLVPAVAQAGAPPLPEPAPNRVAFDPLGERWTGDLDEMIVHRRIRVLVPYSRSTYWVALGKPQGLVYEEFTAYAKEVNRKVPGAKKKKHLGTHVLFLPTRQGDLISGLLEGRGDIAAAGLTITPGREEQVAFSAPLLRDIREVVVTGPESPPIASLDDLEGQEVFVRKSSSYFEHLTEWNGRLQGEGKELVRIRPVPEELEDDDLVEMVSAGLLGITVLDEYKATFWARAFSKIEIHSDLAIHQGGEIAWMIRKNQPEARGEPGRLHQGQREGYPLRQHAD
jgi:membrane-bound lytic murein transglycosylase MltF